jgi:hypothetical protein
MQARSPPVKCKRRFSSPAVSFPTDAIPFPDGFRETKFRRTSSPTYAFDGHRSNNSESLFESLVDLDLDPSSQRKLHTNPPPKRLTYASLPPTPIATSPPSPTFDSPSFPNIPSRVPPPSVHKVPFSLWDYLREELLATDFDSHQELKWERVGNFLSIPLAIEKVGRLVLR